MQGMPRPWHKAASLGRTSACTSQWVAPAGTNQQPFIELDQVGKHSVKQEPAHHGKTGVMPGQLTVSRTSESASFISCTRPATPACFT